jgi:HlyD family secretion protein
MKSTATTTSATQPSTAGPRKPGAWRKYVLRVLGLLLGAALVYGLMPKPLAVEIAPVTVGPLVVSVLEEGKTRIRHRYVVSPPVAGHLRRIELRAGAPIDAGKTVLAVLESEPSSFLNPRARAEAEARIKGAEAAKMRQENEVARVQASLDLAKKEFVRAKDLKQSGAIATKEWDNAEAQVSMLSRELHAAEFGRQVAEFEIAQAQAALMQAQSPSPEKSEPYRILAPVNGFVLNVFEESARIVAPGTPLLEVGDPTDLEAEIELLSSDAVGVQPGADVSIEQWGGEHPLRGKVSVVEPGGYTKISALGVEEQRVKVRVDFVDLPPNGRTLGDRYRVEARIVTWRGDNVLQMPTGALFRRGGDWMTFVFDGSHVKLTKVEIAHNNGVAAEIRDGLRQGQNVVIHPPDPVVDGMKVVRREQR